MSTQSTILSGIDPAIGARLSSRRDFFRAAKTLGVLASAPVVLAQAATTASGKARNCRPRFAMSSTSL